NRQTTMIEATGQSGIERTTTTLYDAVGNVLSVSRPKEADLLDNKGQLTNNPLHVTTTFAYDALNRQTAMTEAVTTALKRTTATSYDANGNVLSVTKPLTYDNASNQAFAVTSYGYDLLNRQTTMIADFGGTGHLNQTTATAYDAANNVVQT